MAPARRFAAALGIIAFVFVAGFGVWQDSGLDWVLLRALVALVMFSVLGFVTGWMGAAIARDSADDEVKRRAAAGQESRREKRTSRGTAGAAPRSDAGPTM